MGVPIVSEANKSKELLLEIDSILPDTKGHHLADISLSSNDSLSRSRRRWKLIKIISKMNPTLQGKSKKLIFYQSLSAILSIILTGIVIYWLVNLNSTSNHLSSELPSSSFLVSSRSSSSTPTPEQASPLPESPSTMTFGLPGKFDSVDYEPLSILDNPVLRLLATSNDTSDGVILKITDIADDDGSDDRVDDNNDNNENDVDSLKDFPPSPIFPPFPSFPSDWFEAKLGRPLFLPPFFPPTPPAQLSPPSIQAIDPFDFNSENFESLPPQTIPDPFSEQFTPATFNLAKIKSSAKRLHASAVGALDEIMRKLKSNQLVDFLVNGDDPEPELIIRSEDNLDDGTGSTVGFIDVDQLADDGGNVDNLFNLLKKIVF